MYVKVCNAIEVQTTNPILKKTDILGSQKKYSIIEEEKFLS